MPQPWGPLNEPFWMILQAFLWIALSFLSDSLYNEAYLDNVFATTTHLNHTLPSLLTPIYIFPIPVILLCHIIYFLNRKSCVCVFMCLHAWYRIGTQKTFVEQLNEFWQNFCPFTLLSKYLSLFVLSTYCVSTGNSIIFVDQFSVGEQDCL